MIISRIISGNSNISTMSGNEGGSKTYKPTNRHKDDDGRYLI